MLGGPKPKQSSLTALTNDRDEKVVKNCACEVYTSRNAGSMPVSITGIIGATEWYPKVRQTGYPCELPPEREHSKTIKGGIMTKLLFCLLFCAATLMAADKTVYDFTLNTIDGQPAPLAAYKGKVVLLVNVASRCGYTPQYAALESIYEKYKGQGFVIVGIPANNFGGQEPGTNAEIKTFCSSKYSVTFPMMAKVSVKGDDTTPLYQFLTDKAANPQTGGEIKWNFTKFLIGPDGHILARFESAVTPDSPQVTSAIEKALASLKS
jgi:glutathione peroxidase